MLNLQDYPWLNGSISFDSVSDGPHKSLSQTLNSISSMMWDDWMKNTAASYLSASFTDPQAKPTGAVLLTRKVSSWKNIPSFVSYCRHQVLQEKEQFQMSSLIAIICETLVIYFLWAIIQERYLINFSVDAVVGVLAGVFLIRNLQVKYRQLSRMKLSSRIMLLDLLAAMLCILLKLWVPPHFDLSLIVLVVTYFIEKKLLQNKLDDSLKEAGVASA